MNVRLLIAAGFLLAGCAERPSAVATRAEPVAPPASKAATLPHKSFDLGKSITLSMTDVEVRLATEQEVLKDRYIGTEEGLAVGGGTLGLGYYVALGAPMYGGAFLGGIIALPLWTYIGVQNDIWISNLEDAINDINFPSRIREATKSALGHTKPMNDQNLGTKSHRLEIVVARYGLVDQCFSVVASFTVWRNEKKIATDNLYWEGSRRHKDFPPAKCATLGEFAGDDARLFRKTLHEASAVIAATIMRRLGDQQ